MVSSSSDNNQDRQKQEPKLLQCPIVISSNKSVFKTPKKDDSNPPGEDSDPRADKFNMSKLCMAFLAKYDGDILPVAFETKDLVKQFNVKQRRIYDLMNIMEGCACIKKISKGRYEWVGVNRTDFEVSPSQKGEASSLRQIACQIKKIVFQTKAKVAFSQIYDVLFQQDSKVRQVNPASLRRRIYECCKVLMSLKLIRRVRKDYEWIHPGENQTNPLRIGTAKSLIRRPRRLQVNQDQLIIEIIRRYKSQQQLGCFVAKLQQRFLSKRSNEKSTQKQEACRDSEEQRIRTTIKKQPIIFQELNYQS